MFRDLRTFLTSGHRLATSEYAVMLALIALAAIGGASLLGFSVGDLFARTAEMLPG